MLERNVRLLTWFNFFIDFRLYFPIAILYFAQVTGSFALGMSVFGMTQLSQAIFEMPTGIFSDYIGRKKTVIVGAFFMVFAVISYSLGVTWALFLGAIFEGIQRAFHSGNNDALLHDSLKEGGNEGEYNHYYGRLSAMYQIASGFAALVGGIIGFYYSFSLVFYISIIPQIICVLLAFKLIEPKNITKQTSNIYSHLKESIMLFIKNPKLRLLSFSDIWSFGLGESGWQFRSAFINMVWPVWAVGIPQIISNFGGAISFFYAGRVIKKFGGNETLLVTRIFNRFISIISLVFVSVFSPILMVSTSFNYGLESTATSSLMQKEFTDKQRATMSSLNSFAGSLFFAFSAYLIGFLADKFNPAQALLIIEVLKSLNVWLSYRLVKLK